MFTPHQDSYSLVFTQVSASASQTQDHHLASCLPSEKLLLSEPSTSMNGHQLCHPTCHPPGWTHPTQQLPSSNSPAAPECPPGHWADPHYLFFPVGLGVPRELISTSAVPVEGAEIKSRSFFIERQQINWQTKRQTIWTVLCGQSLFKGYPTEREFKGANDSQVSAHWTSSLPLSWHLIRPSSNWALWVGAIWDCYTGSDTRGDTLCTKRMLTASSTQVTSSVLVLPKYQKAAEKDASFVLIFNHF